MIRILWVVTLACFLQCEAQAQAVAPPLSTAVIRLAAPDPAKIEALKESNRWSGKAGRGRRIGFQRQISVDLDIAPISAQSGNWQSVEGGQLLRIDVSSPGAVGLRVELRISDDFEGELRFSPSVVPESPYGSYRREDWLGQKTYWSPLTVGETATVELFVPSAITSPAWRVELLSVSHLVALPTQRFEGGNIFRDTGLCEVNIACATSPDVLQAARAVAVMSFIDEIDKSSYVCTGSLIRDKAGSEIPYFYSSHHCIYSQAIADTLNTFWNLQNSKCTSFDPYSARKVLTRGALYLDSEPDNDHALLLLKDALPATATQLDWDLADLESGAQMATIHHPGSDVKKISLGFVDTPPDGSVVMAEDNGGTITHSNVWKVMWTSGVTEPGSSGSALLTCDGSSCKMRGGLIGGSSECKVDNGPDYFSKLSLAYPRLKRWLVEAPSVLQQDCLLDWAAANYRDDFGVGNTPSQYLGGYYFRHYNNDSYLGISMSEGRVYYVGPKSGNTFLNLGDATGWVSTASCR